MFADFLRFTMPRAIRALLFVAAFSAAFPIRADDAAAIRAAFADWRLALYDIPKPDGIPLLNVGWRFVEGEDELAALANRNVLVEGTTNQRGEVLLSKQQRQKLMDAWKRAPDRLWFVYFSHSLKLTLQQNNGKYEIVLVRPEPEYERKRRLAEEQAARDRNTPLSPTVNMQLGFDAAPFAREYADWQGRFKHDLEDMIQVIRRDPALGEKLSQAEGIEELKALFVRSVHAGRKGLSFRRQMFGDYSVRRQATEGTEVTPSGHVVSRLVLSPHAAPVGFGGNFSDDGYNVELWYMVFDDLRDWSMQDFKESLVFSAFSPARLPAYQSIERDAWPALVFVRDEKGRLMLYGFSRELAAILQNIYRHQLF